MIKKIIFLICIMTLVSTTEINADFIYNNEDKVTRITAIDEQQLYTNPLQMITDIIFKYNREYVVQVMGAEPYWRLGKLGIEYAIYRTDLTHYLILTSYNNKTYADRLYISRVVSKELFQKYVTVGTSMDIVKLIYPDTIDFINNINWDYTFSFHRFTDGTFIMLHYNKNSEGKYVVTRIDYQKEQIPIFDNLLDIDYQLIKNNNPNEEAEFLEKLKKLNQKLEDDSLLKPVIKKPAKVKIKSVKHIKKRLILIKFKKAKNAKKYQIQYAFNKKFKKAKIKTTKKTYHTMKVSKKKTYYIRVRGVNSKKKGVWSKMKKVKGLKKR